MKLKYIIIALTIVATLTRCKKDGEGKNEALQEVEKIESKEEAPIAKKITLRLESNNDSDASGSIVFKEEDGIVKMIAVIGGLPEGTHQIHIHQTTDCSSLKEKSTDSKWEATEGFHKGDIGNFEIDENGNGTISKTTDQWCIGCGDPNKDILDKTMVISQEKAGENLACGKIML